MKCRACANNVVHPAVAGVLVNSCAPSNEMTVFGVCIRRVRRAATTHTHTLFANDVVEGALQVWGMTAAAAVATAAATVAAHRRAHIAGASKVALVACHSHSERTHSIQSTASTRHPHHRPAPPTRSRETHTRTHTHRKHARSTHFMAFAETTHTYTQRAYTLWVIKLSARRWAAWATDGVTAATAAPGGCECVSVLTSQHTHTHAHTHSHTRRWLTRQPSTL